MTDHPETDRAWAESQRQKRVVDAKAKIKAGGLVTREDRIELFYDRGGKILHTIHAKMQDRNDRAAMQHAFGSLVADMMGEFIHAADARAAVSEQNARLEGRIDNLECCIRDLRRSSDVVRIALGHQIKGLQQTQRPAQRGSGSAPRAKS